MIISMGPMHTHTALRCCLYVEINKWKIVSPFHRHWPFDPSFTFFGQNLFSFRQMRSRTKTFRTFTLSFVRSSVDFRVHSKLYLLFVAPFFRKIPKENRRQKSIVKMWCRIKNTHSRLNSFRLQQYLRPIGSSNMKRIFIIIKTITNHRKIFNP